MKKEIRTTLIIKAKAEDVWFVLTDFKSYPQWNPFIRSLTGEVAVGNRIRAVLLAGEGKPMTFKPKVLRFSKNQEFRWLGRLIFPGLFDGEHIFELIDNGDGSTTFVQREKFRGILVGMLSKKLDTTTVNGFRAMNEALKQRTESLQRTL